MSTQHTQRDYLAPGEGGLFRLEQQTDGDRLILHLVPATCVTRSSEQDVVTETEYHATGFMGGPGLALGGAAVAGLGTALFVSAKNQPDSCAPDDQNCFSKDDARVASALAWGLGGAAIAVGLYRAFKPPVAVGSHLLAVGAPRFSDQTNPCNVSSNGQPGWLRLSSGASARAIADGEGFVSFNLNGDAIPAGTTAEFDVNHERFFVDISAIARGNVAPPPAPPSNDAAAEQCTLPQSDGARLGFAACALLLTALAEQGVEWASDEASERMGNALGLSPDSFARKVLSKILGRYSGQVTEEVREALVQQACCALVVASVSQ